MIQQINFYRFLPKKPWFRLTFEVMGFCYAVFFLLLMLSYSVDTWKKHESLQALKHANIQNELVLKRLSELVMKYGATTPDELERSMEQLQKNMQVHSHLLKQLAGQVLFSNYLQAFAEAVPSGVWLTNFTFSTNQTKIDIKGHSLLAVQTQQFLDQLQKQPVFANTTFVLQSLEQPQGAEANKYFDFYITTRVGEGE